MAVAEWTCEGCGVPVIGIGISEPPSHQLCAVCAWLCEYIPDPEAMMHVHRGLERGLMRCRPAEPHHTRVAIGRRE